MNEETLDKTPFMRELEATLNRYCMENTSNTPDFILAEYMLRCLRAGEYLIDRREQLANFYEDYKSYIEVEDENSRKAEKCL
jgi:hypothetical protein